MQSSFKKGLAMDNLDYSELILVVYKGRAGCFAINTSAVQLLRFIYKRLGYTAFAAINNPIGVLPFRDIRHVVSRFVEGGKVCCALVVGLNSPC